MDISMGRSHRDGGSGGEDIVNEGQAISGSNDVMEQGQGDDDDDDEGGKR